MMQPGNCCFQLILCLCLAGPDFRCLKDVCYGPSKFIQPEPVASEFRATGATRPPIRSTGDKSLHAIAHSNGVVHSKKQPRLSRHYFTLASDIRGYDGESVHAGFNRCNRNFVMFMVELPKQA